MYILSLSVVPLRRRKWYNGKIPKVRELWEIPCACLHKLVILNFPTFCSCNVWPRGRDAVFVICRLYIKVSCHKCIAKISCTFVLPELRVRTWSIDMCIYRLPQLHFHKNLLYKIITLTLKHIGWLQDMCLLL